MAKLSYFFRDFDWPLVLSAVVLTCLGLVSIYSSSITNGDFLDFKKQLVFFTISLLALFLVSRFDFRVLKVNSYITFFFYVLCCLLLLGLLFFGDYTRGIRGWYKLGPISFDPKPYAALVLIMLLSKYFASRHIEIARFQPILVSGVYVAIPVVLMALEPDLGSSITLIAVWLGVLLFSGIHWKHFLILTFIFLMIFGLGWKFWLKDYQRARILSFLNPQSDQQGAGWSVKQSKIAIGSGGVLGAGLGKGSQTQYGFLSEPKTDFIFSAIAEEMGAVGLLLLFAAFIFLFWRILRVAFVATSNFTRFFASGLACLIVSQNFINIGMCLGILPVVGIPLSFVSYGGSQLLAFYIGLGVLLSLERAG